VLVSDGAPLRRWTTKAGQLVGIAQCLYQVLAWSLWPSEQAHSHAMCGESGWDRLSASIIVTKSRNSRAFSWRLVGIPVPRQIGVDRWLCTSVSVSVRLNVTLQGRPGHTIEARNLRCVVSMPSKDIRLINHGGTLKWTIRSDSLYFGTTNAASIALKDLVRDRPEKDPSSPTTVPSYAVQAPSTVVRVGVVCFARRLRCGSLCSHRANLRSYCLPDSLSWVPRPLQASPKQEQGKTWIVAWETRQWSTVIISTLP